MDSQNTEWHQMRAKGIGGSDIAAIMGMSRYKTALDVYLQKIGIAPQQDDSWELGRGRALEPLLRQHYANKTGRTVVVPKEQLVHPDHVFIRYSPDGICPEEHRLQEFKTASYNAEWGDEFSDSIPHEYLLQVQHGMLVTGYPIADVTVSIGGNAPRYFEVVADEEIQTFILEECIEFWHRVETKQPPPPATNGDVAKMYRAALGRRALVTDQIAEELKELRNVRAQIDELEEVKEAHEVKIKNFMGEADTLVNASGEVLATWREQKGASRIDNDLLRKAYPDIANQVTKIGDPFRRFLLK